MAPGVLQPEKEFASGRAGSPPAPTDTQVARPHSLETLIAPDTRTCWVPPPAPPALGRLRGPQGPRRVFSVGQRSGGTKHAVASASLLATRSAPVSPVTQPGSFPAQAMSRLTAGGAPQSTPPSSSAVLSAAGHPRSLPPPMRATAFNKYFIFSVCNNDHHMHDNVMI